MSTSYPNPQPLFIGIDTGKQQLDVASHPNGQHWIVANDPAGHRKLITQLAKLDVQAIVLEASGGYERPVAQSLRHAGFSVAVVNPCRVRQYARAMGVHAKTDKIDAHLIAAFAKAVRPVAQPKSSEKQQQRQAWGTRRKQLITMRTAEKNRLKQTPEDDLRRMIQVTIALFNDQIKQLDGQLQADIAADPQARPVDRVLQGVVGVGPGVSRTLIAHLPELGRVDRQQIACLAGLAPFNQDSGQHRGVRKIRGGRAEVRTKLYMAVMSAKQHNPVIRTHYNQLIQRGKLHKVAMVACMRKMLIHLNSLAADIIQQEIRTGQMT